MIILFFFFERRNIINDRPPPLKKYLYCYTYLSKKKYFFLCLFITPLQHIPTWPLLVYKYFMVISSPSPVKLHEICSLQNVTKYFLFLVYYYIIAKFCEMRIIITMGYTVPIFKGAIFQSNKKYTVSLYFIIIKVCWNKAKQSNWFRIS